MAPAKHRGNSSGHWPEPVQLTLTASPYMDQHRESPTTLYFLMRSTVLVSIGTPDDSPTCWNTASATKLEMFQPSAKAPRPQDFPGVRSLSAVRLESLPSSAGISPLK